LKNECDHNLKAGNAASRFAPCELKAMWPRKVGWGAPREL